MESARLQLGWACALVVLGLIVLVGPALAAGEPESDITREAIVHNDIRLTSWTASAATAVGVSVHGYDVSERTVWEEGATKVQQTTLEVELRSVEMAKVYELAAKLKESDAPVQMQRVTLKRRRGESTYDVKLFVATSKTNADSLELLPKRFPDQIRVADAWRLTTGLVQVLHEELLTVDRLDVDTDRRIVEIHGLVAKPQDFEKFEKMLGGAVCLTNLERLEPLEVVERKRMRFRLRTHIDCDTAPRHDPSYQANHWEFPSDERKRDKKSVSSDDDSGKAPATGKVTVYSKPKGEIVIDGVFTDEKTPGTVRVMAGDHEVRVRFEGSGSLSESTTIHPEEGSDIKLFFRQQSE